MIAVIKDEFHHDLVFHLSYLKPHNIDIFNILNKEQKGSVALFLKYLLESEDYYYESKNIQKTLDQYWLKS